MEFRILGPVEVSAADGPLKLGGRKQRLVLAHLIVRANALVPTDVLIDAVWGDEPPDSVRSTIQGYVSHLRRSLGDRLEGRSAGYILHVEDGELDAAAFEAEVRQAKRTVEADPAGAAASLVRALGRWRGPVFGDLSDESSLQSEIARLDELRMSATEYRIGAELAVGRHSTIVSELEALTGRYPLRERLWAHLMLALYQGGREAQALDAYQRARRVLADELGADPSAELQRLNERILEHDPALRIQTAARAPEPPPRAARGDLEPGTEFAGYRIMAVLGRGGMSVVYLAEHLGLERKVALKVLAPQLAHDERFRERFVRETRIAAGMEHQNIVPIFEAGEAEGLLFLAMRYVPGTDLGRLIRRDGKLDAERTVWLIREAASALDAAHARGLVHRDVKPGNILVVEGEGSEGRDLVYLSDFGLTKRLEGGTGGALTQTGQFVGTVDYVAPEQIEGRTVDARTDVYSLACVLFECLTGSVPFERDSQVAALYAHLGERPPRLTAVRPDLPPEIDDVVAKALAKSPAERYATCGGFSVAAREALRPPSETSVGAGASGWRRWRPLVGAAAAALVTGVIVFSVSRGETPAAQGGEVTRTPTESPAPDPVFRTVERQLSQDEVRLLGYIPTAVANDCAPLAREPPVRGELAALACITTEGEVLYELFETRNAMDAAFQINVNTTGAPEGDCSAEQEAVSTYTIDGVRAGQVLCYTVEPGEFGVAAGERDSSHIEWTQENGLIYAHAVRGDLGDLSLYEWWLSSAGPIVPAGSDPSLSVKDAPGSSGSRLRDGTFLIQLTHEEADAIPILTSTTYAIRLDAGGYHASEAGSIYERGRTYLRKPNTIVFAPSTCIGSGPGVLRPVEYEWTATAEGVSWERIGGGTCAGPQPFPDRPWTRAPAGLIAVESGNDIALIESGGYVVQKLTDQTRTHPNVWADWSPDGSMIVYSGVSRDFDLYVMNADGSEVVRITQDAGDEIAPDWSPLGDRIAFTFDDLGEPNYRAGIAVVDTSGGGRTDVVTQVNERPESPLWSPDGSQIAFTLFTVDGPIAYVMDADGSNLTEVHDQAVALAWTPDGRRIVLSAHSSIRSVLPDGSADEVILKDPPSNGRIVLDWSPDGRWILMTDPFGQGSVLPGANVGSSRGTNVYLARSDGGEIFLVGSGSEPSWRPRD